jgi:hypothetical protein
MSPQNCESTQDLKICRNSAPHNSPISFFICLLHSATWSFVWLINGEPSDSPIRGANHRNGGPEPSGGDNRRDRFGKEHPALSDAAPQRLHQVWTHRRHSAASSRCSLSREVEFQTILRSLLGFWDGRENEGS